MLLFLFRFFIVFLLGIPLYYGGLSMLGNDVQITGFLSYYYLIFVLLVSPLSYVFFKIKILKKYANTLTAFRRPIGIIAGLLALAHGFKFEQRVYGLWEKYFSSHSTFGEFLYTGIFESSNGTVLGMSPYSFWFGFGGGVIMLLLLGTSNNLSQRIFGAKFWKHLQKLVYPLFILVVLHIYFVGGWKGLYMYPALVVVLLRFYVWFDKNFQYKGKAHISHSGYRRFLCQPCGFIYDEELGDPDGGLIPGTKFEEIPDDRSCPECGAMKKDFVPLDGHYNPEHEEDHELTFEMRSKKYLTDDVVELAFYCKRELEILPGQFCNLIFNHEDEKNKITRSYSVVKYIDNLVYFGIKLKPDGKGGNAIKNLQVGDTIKALGPFGDFILKNTSQKKVFIATGTGLSPIYYMMETAWNVEKELYLGVQKEKDLFYLEELEKIPNLKVHIYLSREEHTSYNSGRISYEKIQVESSTEVYVCGSPGLIESLKNDFEKAGKKHVYYEKFL